MLNTGFRDIETAVLTMFLKPFECTYSRKLNKKRHVIVSLEVTFCVAIQSDYKINNAICLYSSDNCTY